MIERSCSVVYGYGYSKFSWNLSPFLTHKEFSSDSLNLFVVFYYYILMKFFATLPLAKPDISKELNFLHTFCNRVLTKLCSTLTSKSHHLSVMLIMPSHISQFFSCYYLSNITHCQIYLFFVWFLCFKFRCISTLSGKTNVCLQNHLFEKWVGVWLKFVCCIFEWQICIKEGLQLNLIPYTYWYNNKSKAFCDTFQSLDHP